MEIKKLNILIVDKHPFVIDLYTDIINKTNTKGQYNFQFITATNTENAIQKINLQLEANKHINVAFFDINITPFEKIQSGSDLILFLKQKYPTCKVVIVTDLEEPIKIYNLIQKVNIEVILCKSDMNYEMLSKLCIDVDFKQKYMSDSVQEKIAFLTKKKLNLDHFDLEIIEKMSQGIKTIDLPNFIPLSLSAIEKRKAKLKIDFIENKGTDKMLLDKLKSLGLLQTVKV
jgi:DNA-binding NarL/FixJ family response regulator